ncbi:predicted protein [Naegleria gruberi]|uniref:DNA 3'-5' helicase n=1 Tax=Naegleria gruberi TaxID=5762 RepID=D2VNB2_NAEGR|nr:uncharacterized protein NAEGRDRAFT_50960 [Naegleria gruberi]EFC41711.1 predicted protein [Naegleria gruberi]|eukprot:XP_002674455.1 predicted protein [Naegleria gruberi strain NEG-M]
MNNSQQEETNQTQHSNNPNPTNEKNEKKRRKSETKSKNKKTKYDNIENDTDSQISKQAEKLATDIFKQKEGIQFDHSSMDLKSDHESRPIWVCSGDNGDYHIFMETNTPVYQQAYDFLVAIAEPISRMENLHEYQLKEFSLYGAVSIGLTCDYIIQVLDKLSKVKLPTDLIDFIRKTTSKYGSVKFVLQKNRFFLESPILQIIEKLRNDSVIGKAALIPNPNEFEYLDSSKRFIIKSKSNQVEAFQKQTLISTNSNSLSNTMNEQHHVQKEMIGAINHSNYEEEYEDDNDLDSEPHETLYSFEISSKSIESVKKQCIVIGHPTLDEYDFRNDKRNSSLVIDLKPTTTIRSYQEKSLNKMFSNGRARSGIIVLPCGAGKTLVGVTAASTIKKHTLVLCINTVSVFQWKNQFRLWSTIDDDSILVHTSQQKATLPKDPNKAVVLITTYSMISFKGRRSEESKQMMEYIENREWGLLMFDEVQVYPADSFRASHLKAHCKLGLTATLLREDNKQEDLNFLIGPKLYEANWLDLQKKGHLANVQCVEVWCPMTAEFYAEYLSSNYAKQSLYYVMNPNKFRACEFLIRYHEKHGDKIIVFSDNTFTLEQYAIKLKLPYIYGKTRESERLDVLNRFKSGNFNTVFLSKVGDTAIDIPEATVIIQISSHFGSRRQEAQRLGRILRPKNGTNKQAYFYSLVSQDTKEMFFATKRQQFLTNQGYSFRVLADIQKYYSSNRVETKFMKTKEDELEFLKLVKNAKDVNGKLEDIPNDDFQSGSHSGDTSLALLSGGANEVYYHTFEASNSSKKKKKVAKTVHPLFKKRN